jgi:hypothetical protein
VYANLRGWRSSRLPPAVKRGEERIYRPILPSAFPSLFTANNHAASIVCKYRLSCSSLVVYCRMVKTKEKLGAKRKDRAEMNQRHKEVYAANSYYALYTLTIGIFAKAKMHQIS